MATRSRAGPGISQLNARKRTGSNKGKFEMVEKFRFFTVSGDATNSWLWNGAFSFFVKVPAKIRPREDDFSGRFRKRGSFWYILQSNFFPTIFVTGPTICSIGSTHQPLLVGKSV
jgi:hypothetical protein